MPWIRNLVLVLVVLSAAVHAADDAITTALQPFVDRKVLAGAVTLTVNKDAVLGTQTVGYMDVEAKKAMPADALVWIASMSKPITSTALMMLVDEGKVKLDDPVEKFIPEFKGMGWVEKGSTEKKVAPPITIRQILSHTSGLPFKSAVEAPTLDALPLKDTVLSYTKEALIYEPSTKYVYSNEGINTAGRIIEIVSGMPYEEFLNKRLFEPLGMKDTTFWPNDEQMTRLAKSYKPNAAKDGLEVVGIWALQTPYTDKAKRFPMPGGGLFSTAQDLGKFCRMILNGGTLDGKKYITPESIAEMGKRQTPETLKDSYGLGWSSSKDSFGHGGAFATNMTIDTKRGLAYIYLVQHNGFPGDGGKANDVYKNAAIALYAK